VISRRALFSLLATSLLIPCCGTLPGGRSSILFDSTSHGHLLEPTFTTQVFTSEDLNTADVYLTDIPGLGTPDATGVGMTGNVLHIHMFLYPKAGQTPIDFTASNTTITHVVLADGAYGVYAGAGFLLPSGKPTKGSTFKGHIADATMMPVSATSGFDDLLGWNELSGSVNSERDDDRAEQIRQFLAAILANPNLAPLQ
jgi:hypothetical protein